MRRTVSAGLVTVMVIGLGVGRASADAPLLNDSYYEVGPVFFSGGIPFPDGNDRMSGSGIHIYERNGMLSKVIFVAFFAMMQAMGRSNTEYVGSDSTYDYYRIKSPEEMAEEDRRSAEALDAAAKNDYQLDFQIFWDTEQEGAGHARGFSWEIVPFSYNMKNGGVIEVGFLIASIRDTVCNPAEGMTGPKERCHYLNVGLPLRVAVPLTRMAQLNFEWDMNFMGLASEEHGESYASPFRVSLTLHPWERLFARGGAYVSEFSTDVEKVGITLEGGFRF